MMSMSRPGRRALALVASISPSRLYVRSGMGLYHLHATIPYRRALAATALLLSLILPRSESSETVLPRYRASRLHETLEPAIDHELDAAREGGELADLDVVCHPFAVIQRAMLAPDLAGLLRHAAVGGKVLLRHRDDKSIDVRHRHSLPLSLNRRARLWIMSGNWWRRPASGRFRQPVQSTCTPAALTTFSHFSVSATIILPKASGGPISGSPPRSISFALIAGSASTALISLFSFSMISLGVFFGTPMPNSALAS